MSRQDCEKCHRVLLQVNGALRCVVRTCSEYNKPVEAKS